MDDNSYCIQAPVVVYPGPSAWRFVSIPPGMGAQIKRRYGDRAAGWGSIRVRVSLGASVWDTSLFPDKRSGSYLLPLKASVRTKEGVVDGGVVSLVLEVR